MNGKTLIQAVIGVAIAGSAAAAFDALVAPSSSMITPVHGEAEAPGGTLAFLLPPPGHRLVVGTGRSTGTRLIARQILP